jgi:site-specific recombinase XerD
LDVERVPNGNGGGERQAVGQEIGPLAPLAQAARDFMRQAKAENTVTAYRSDWRHFTAWCGAHGRVSLPASPETLALYLSDLAIAHKVSTVTRRAVAINQAHQAAGHESATGTATVKTLLAGIRRVKGTAPTTKAPALMEDIRLMVRALPSGILGTRDRALVATY